jgi:hypothetical protein
MYDGYCFRCGTYTTINQVTKMCRPCLDHWCATPRRRPAG